MFLQQASYTPSFGGLGLRDPSGQAPIRDYNEMEYGDVRTAIEASPNFGHHERVQFGLALHHGDLGEDSDPIFLRLQALLRFCKDHDYPWAVGAAIDAFMQRSYPNSVSDGDAYMDGGYKVMASTRTERGFETLDGSAVEAAFSFYKVLPAAEPSGLYITVPDVITFIDSVLDAFDNSVDSPDKAFPAGYLSLRVCGRTDALLGMERFDRNAMVEVVLISSPDGYHLVRQVEEIARNQGAALHWGQSNGLMEFIDLEFVYGNSRIDRWRAVQRQLGGETFTNYFMQRCGLSEQNRGGW